MRFCPGRSSGRFLARASRRDFPLRGCESEGRESFLGLGQRIRQAGDVRQPGRAVGARLDVHSVRGARDRPLKQRRAGAGVPGAWTTRCCARATSRSASRGCRRANPVAWLRIPRVASLAEPREAVAAILGLMLERVPATGGPGRLSGLLPDSRAVLDHLQVLVGLAVELGRTLAVEPAEGVPDRRPRAAGLSTERSRSEHGQRLLAPPRP